MKRINDIRDFSDDKGFTLLLENCRLPSWIIEPHQLDAITTVPVGGSHGEERRGIDLIDEMQADQELCPPRTMPIIANLKAVEEKVRFKDIRQVMAWYSFEADLSTNEGRVAAAITWLSQRLKPQTLFIDFHSNPTGAEFAMMPRNAPIAAVSAACLLGQRSVIVAQPGENPFHDTINNSLVIELHEDIGKAQREEDAFILQAIGKIDELGSAELERYFYTHLIDGWHVYEKMRWYKSAGEVCIVDPWQPNRLNRRVAPFLAEIEAIKSPGWERTIHFGAAARKALGLGNLEVSAPYWGYGETAGPKVSNAELGLDDEVARRITIGALAHRLPWVPIVEKGEHYKQLAF